MNSLLRLVIGALACLAFPSCAGSQSQRKLCGIELSTKVARVLATVEEAYTEPVQCTFDPSYHGWGYSRVDIVGRGITNPRIILNGDRNPDEVEILHELLHLRMNKQGFPVIFDTDAPILPNINDFLEHVVIYPEMRKMGFDPAAKDREQVKKLLSDALPPKTDGDFQFWAFQYARSVLQFEDRELGAGLENKVKKDSWDKSIIVRGTELVSSVRKSDLSKPEQLAEEDARCLEILGGHKVAFKATLDWPILRVDSGSNSQ